MRVYIGNTGHVKNHQNFKILFWSQESKKTIFSILWIFFYEQKSGNPKIVTGRPGARSGTAQSGSWEGSWKPSTDWTGLEA